jgi:hypothetical protein
LPVVHHSELKRGKNEKTFLVYKVFLDKFRIYSVKGGKLPVNNEDPLPPLRGVEINPRQQLKPLSLEAV